MKRAKPVIAYGTRGRLSGADSGIRRVAPSFGKVLHLTSSDKAGDRFAVESDAERLVSHLLTVDPRVRRFEPQPFTVDLVDGRILRSREAVAEARHKHRQRTGWRFYTPDFGFEHAAMPRAAAEVKLEGYEGDADYQAALGRAEEVLDAAGYRFARMVVPADAKHPLRANLQLLKMAKRRPDLQPDAQQQQRIEAACGHEAVTLSALCSVLSIAPGAVPAWLMCGAVRSDVVRQPICGSMMLEAAFGDLSHLHLLEELMR